MRLSGLPERRRLWSGLNPPDGGCRLIRATRSQAVVNRIVFPVLQTAVNL